MSRMVVMIDIGSSLEIWRSCLAFLGSWLVGMMRSGVLNLREVALILVMVRDVRSLVAQRSCGVGSIECFGS